jgi:hypothetical protein
MARRISMATRNELMTALAERYARSSKAERGVILDEFVAVSGYHRKHAIRLLRSGEKPTAASVGRVRRRYGDAVREALIALWEASDRLCSKRLKPLLPVLLPTLERHAGWRSSPMSVAWLLEISPASIDRPFAALERVVHEFLHRYRTLTGEPSQHDPYRQLEMAIEAVMRSWMSEKAQTFRRLRGLRMMAARR